MEDDKFDDFFDMAKDETAVKSSRLFGCSTYFLVIVLVVLNSLVVSYWFNLNWLVLLRLQVVVSVLSVECINLFYWLIR
jgi:hypothetical protein